jgi:hypothetical protein
MNDETDWARIAAMTEADIEGAATEHPDASLTTAAIRRRRASSGRRRWNRSRYG